LEKLRLNFDTILLFTILYSFVWLKEKKWNFGWNFQICTMNFKSGRKRKFLIEIREKDFKILHEANKVLSHITSVHNILLNVIYYFRT